jgi:hypothetical protein
LEVQRELQHEFRAFSSEEFVTIANGNAVEMKRRL